MRERLKKGEAELRKVPKGLSLITRCKPVDGFTPFWWSM